MLNALNKIEYNLQLHIQQENSQLSNERHLPNT